MQFFLLFAFAAMLCWAIGDFLIQRMTRKTDPLVTLTVVGIVAIVGLAPFVMQDLATISGNDLLVLLVLGAITFIGGIADFAALRDGKISVVDIVIAFELPITVLLGVAFFHETIGMTEAILIIALLVSLLLVSVKRISFTRFTLEKGLYYAVLAAVGMGLVNFLTAHAARGVTPITAVWFPAVVYTGICLIALGTRRKKTSLWESVRPSWGLFLAMGLADTAAWVFYAYATSQGELAITTAITESYPALTLILGVTFNRERLECHQWLGAAAALGCSVVLAILV